MSIKKRAVYTKRISLKKAGTGAETMDGDRVEHGQRVVLNSIAFEDATTLLTYVRIGKFTQGYFHIWEEQKNVPAGEVVFSTEEHLLAEGEKFRCEISGGAANDVCNAYIDGWTEYLK